jgi:hypothetical protein
LLRTTGVGSASLAAPYFMGRFLMAACTMSLVNGLFSRDNLVAALTKRIRENKTSKSEGVLMLSTLDVENKKKSKEKER